MITRNRMMSNAEFSKNMIKEFNKINLKPVQEEHIMTFQEHYAPYFQKQIQRSKFNENVNYNKTTLKNQLLSTAIFEQVLNPVLERFDASEREKNLGMGLIQQFVLEHGAEEIIDDFKYKNEYLATIALDVNKKYDYILENNGIKEGLSEKDIEEIENKEIKGYEITNKNKFPKSITSTIYKRVADSIEDFIDDKKSSQFKIQEIYKKAKEKIDQYNMTKDTLGIGAQTDTGTGIDGIDPELANDANLNTKLDAQQAQDQMNMAGTDPNAGSMGMMPSPQQEALAIAKRKERLVLESSYGVFDGMMRAVLNNIHTNQALSEEYEYNGKTNLDKVFKDVRVMYSLLEAFNTLNIIKVDEDYIKSMLQEIYNQ